MGERTSVDETTWIRKTSAIERLFDHKLEVYPHRLKYRLDICSEETIDEDLDGSSQCGIANATSKQTSPF